MPTQAWQASEPNTRPMGRSTRHCHLSGLQESVRTRTVGRQEAGHMAHMLFSVGCPRLAAPTTTHQVCRLLLPRRAWEDLFPSMSSEVDSYTPLTVEQAAHSVDTR